MKIIVPEHFDRVLNAPYGWKPSVDGECAALPVRVIHYEEGHTGMESFWRPSPEELEALNRGALVSLTVLGHKHPPVLVSVNEEVKENRIPKEILGG